MKGYDQLMSEFDPRLTLRHNPQPRIDQGFYLAKVELVGDSPSKYGTPMLTLRWRLSHSRNAGPFTYLWRIPITETDIHKLTKVNQAFRLPTPSLSRLLSGEDVIKVDDYLGKTALIGLKSEQYTDPGSDAAKWRSYVVDVLPASRAIRLMAVVPEGESL